MDINNADACCADADALGDALAEEDEEEYDAAVDVAGFVSSTSVSSSPMVKSKSYFFFSETALLGAEGNEEDVREPKITVDEELLINLEEAIEDDDDRDNDDDVESA